MRPISLFVEKGSKGIAVLRAPAPPKVACRTAIWTSAEVPFVKTLVTPTQGFRLQVGGEVKTRRSEPRVLLGYGTSSAVQRGIQFRYRRWDVARMVEELDLGKSDIVPIRKSQERQRSRISIHRCTSKDWHLDVENDNPRRKG
jgi:hypothetical protein